MNIEEIRKTFELLACNSNYKSAEVLLEVGGKTVPVDRISISASMSSNDREPKQIFYLHAPGTPAPEVQILEHTTKSEAIDNEPEYLDLDKNKCKIDFFYYEKYDPVFIRPNRKGKKRFSGMTATISAFGPKNASSKNEAVKYIFLTPELLSAIDMPIRTTEKVRLVIDGFDGLENTELFDITDIELAPAVVGDNVKIKSTGECGIVDGFASRQLKDGDYEIVNVSVLISDLGSMKKEYALVAFDDIENLSRPRLSRRYQKFTEVKNELLKDRTEDGEHDGGDTEYEILDPDGDAVCDPRYP